MVLGLVALGVPRIALVRAQGTDAVASIDYAAAPACPRGDAFAAELASRAPHARIVPPDAHVRAFVVRVIAGRTSGYAGRLTVREVDGTETERAVAGDTCESVISGLAVIAGVALSPSGGTTPAASSSEKPAPPPPRDEAPSPTVVEPARVAQPRFALAAGVHGGAVAGITEDALVVVPVFVEAEDLTGRVLAPAARLRLLRTGSGSVTRDGTAAGAQITWTAASLDLCPLRFGGDTLSARPCARIEAGTLEVAGVGVEPSRTAVRPWLAAGPVLRGRWQVLGPMFLELDAALHVAFVRDRFLVEPNTLVFRVPSVGGTLSAGLGVAFLR